jgi:Mrp family chromosome partitioning ATPase
MTDDKKKLQQEHEAKYMKYMADFEACGGDFSSCGGKCDSCSSKCSEAQADQKTPKKAARIVAVFSGKGGTGKSVVTCLLADKLRNMGKKVAVLDADLANPSIHYLYGKVEPCGAEGQHILPMVSDSGVEFISMGNVEKDQTQPLLSYGKDIAEGALYFYLNVKWSQDLDFMLVDMPSGIGDVPLQIGTIVPFDGAVCVANPSDLNDMLGKKSVNLMKMIMIPVLGVVENKTQLVTDQGAVLLGTEPQEHAAAIGVPLLAEVPLSLELSVMADFGRICDAQVPELDSVAEILAK